MDDLKPLPGLTKYNLLSRVRRLPTDNPRDGDDWYWLWACDCGGSRVARLKHVRSGQARHCVGCPIGTRRTCGQCGTEFLHGKRPSKYCSGECRRKACRPEPKERPAENRVCPNCGREFVATPGRRGRVQTTCSRSCTASRPRRLPKAKACDRCGKEFTSEPTAGRPRRYCSQECTAKAQIERSVAGKLCPDCGGPIKSAGSSRCGGCRARTRAERVAARLAGRLLDCPQCGASFTPTNHGQRFCSDPCRKQDGWQNRQNLKRASGNGERVSQAKVYARSGGVCQLCGDPVDRAVLWPDPLSASIDHIVPLSKGGPHTLTNCQLAHLGCNSRKNNRTEAECLAIE